MTEADGADGAGAWDAADSARFLDLLATLPYGPLGMSAAFPGVVETSSSVGVATTDGDATTILSLSRSASDAILPEVTGGIAAAARLAGAELERGPVYPGWRPDLTKPAARGRAGHARAAVRRRAGGAPHPRRARGGGDRRQAAWHPTGAVVRPVDRGAARAGVAAQHPVGGPLHAAAGRAPRRPVALTKSSNTRSQRASSFQLSCSSHCTAQHPRVALDLDRLDHAVVGPRHGHHAVAERGRRAWWWYELTRADVGAVARRRAASRARS